MGADSHEPDPGEGASQEQCIGANGALRKREILVTPCVCILDDDYDNDGDTEEDDDGDAGDGDDDVHVGGDVDVDGDDGGD